MAFAFCNDNIVPSLKAILGKYYDVYFMYACMTSVLICIWSSNKQQKVLIIKWGLKNSTIDLPPTGSTFLVARLKAIIDIYCCAFVH